MRSERVQSYVKWNVHTNEQNSHPKQSCCEQYMMIVVKHFGWWWWCQRFTKYWRVPSARSLAHLADQLFLGHEPWHCAHRSHCYLVDTKIGDMDKIENRFLSYDVVRLMMMGWSGAERSEDGFLSCVEIHFIFRTNIKIIPTRSINF